MTVEALSTDQAQNWFPIDRARGEPTGRIDPAEHRFVGDQTGEEWPMPVVQPPQFIPRVFPGL